MKTISIVGIMISALLLGLSPNHHEVQGIVKDKDGSPLMFANVLEKGTTNGITSDIDGRFKLNVSQPNATLIISYTGYKSKEIELKGRSYIEVVLEEESALLDEVVVMEEVTLDANTRSLVRKSKAPPRTMQPMICGTPPVMQDQVYHLPNTESYQNLNENTYKMPKEEPLSTFSIDVDRAAYSNVRRFINNGSLPPKDAVRIEEMINYFSYDYDGPKDKDPFKVHTELYENPWKTGHQLLHIGIQGKKFDKSKAVNSNIVFLLDVSGSMNSPNKLPLVKSSLKMLTKQLNKNDKVAIVVYAGAAGLVLPSTSGADKQKIIEAFSQLNAGGSTAGGAGIELAYKIAKENFIKGGNNRVILATDGDFNVGASSDEDMADLIEEKRKSGIFLSVLGFGMGNYKDSKMQELAGKGNGNHAYIDNIHEARKTLVEEFGSTLFTIAKDVKIQIEFNPSKVKSYRLIGYENRMLAKEDFNNDQKDAGELGAGHTVTAIYEIEPHGTQNPIVDDLKYGSKAKNNHQNELATIKLRYKKPDGNKSIKLEEVIDSDSKKYTDTNKNVRWATAVAGFGLLLKDSDYKGELSYPQIVNMAKSAKSQDEYGYQAEFIKLVESVEAMSIDDLVDTEE